MEMHPVNSSLITGIGYDQQDEVLRIQFRGETFDYYKVPKYIFENLMSSFSKSRYYASYIKDAYPYLEVVKERELTY
ncbi:KTSC domain-containing protein [Jeotgalibacillus proteolyticus]|uniref:KTSC domain-containing protein n=1 Tax=Jeotgalibacillus proteolyticus TaxID=2082395 RepID=A0A2S5GCC6_9BACL|nr:KTSC domain-containing protein [Jeotgalibacillus proteolyticus]PPA70660.1 KTSC domain-containing protein [Jeotgalibacillus proteolyticus]